MPRSGRVSAICTRSHGSCPGRFPATPPRYEPETVNPFIMRNFSKCILCGRCIKACDEVQGVGAIDYAYKGFQTKICPPFERDLSCEFCGQSRQPML